MSDPKGLDRTPAAETPHPDIPALLEAWLSAVASADFNKVGPAGDALSDALRTTHEARVRAEEALLPFASADQFDDDVADHERVTVGEFDIEGCPTWHVTVGDFRRARAALSLPQGET